MKIISPQEGVCVPGTSFDFITYWDIINSTFATSTKAKKLLPHSGYPDIYHSNDIWDCSSNLLFILNKIASFQIHWLIFCWFVSFFSFFSHCVVALLLLLFALYQITVICGGRHICRWSVSPEMFLCLHLINPVTVDWAGGSGDTQCLLLANTWNIPIFDHTSTTCR